MDIPATASSDQKLDLIIAAIGTLIKGQEALNGLLNKVNKLEAKVDTQEATIASLSKEIISLKDAANDRDNDARGNNVRIFNLPMAEDETNVATKVYDKLIKPILTAAKANGDISSVPVCGNVIESAFRLGRRPPPGSDKPPPPILVRFVSRNLRVATLRNKWNHLPSPS